MATIAIDGIEYFVHWDGILRDEDGNPKHLPPPQRPLIKELSRPTVERQRPRHGSKRPPVIQVICMSLIGADHVSATAVARRSSGRVTGLQSINAFHHLVTKGWVVEVGKNVGRGGASIYKATGSTEWKQWAKVLGL